MELCQLINIERVYYLGNLEDLQVILSQCIKFHRNQYRMKMIKRRIARPPQEFPTQEWEQVLESAKREQDIQEYLERYAELMSGLFDLQNRPLHDIVISKLPFGADLKYELIFKHIDQRSHSSL